MHVWFTNFTSFFLCSSLSSKFFFIFQFTRWRQKKKDWGVERMILLKEKYCIISSSLFLAQMLSRSSSYISFEMRELAREMLLLIPSSKRFRCTLTYRYTHTYTWRHVRLVWRWTHSIIIIRSTPQWPAHPVPSLLYSLFIFYFTQMWYVIAQPRYINTHQQPPASIQNMLIFYFIFLSDIFMYYFY